MQVGVDARTGVDHRESNLAARSRRARDGHRAVGSVVLDGVGQEVEQDLLESLLVTEDLEVVVRLREDRDAELVRLRRHEFDALLLQVLQDDRFDHDADVPRLDARDVEDLVDEFQQVLARVVDVAHHLELVGRLQLHLEDLREAEHGVERRAQFVAHARHELALGGVGALGRLLGLLQDDLGGDGFGDVARHQHRARLVTGLVADQASARFDGQHPTVDVLVPGSGSW